MKFLSRNVVNTSTSLIRELPLNIPREKYLKWQKDLQDLIPWNIEVRSND